jgi:GxxExxY protein
MALDLGEVIKEIANDVYEELGSGHTEAVYHRAMEIGLRLHKDKIKYESGKVLELTYRGYYVGEGFADLLVGAGDDTIAVELKAVAQNMGRHEEQQLRNYMKVLKVNRGLLINFQHLNKAKSPKKLTELEIKTVSV